VGWRWSCGCECGRACELKVLSILGFFGLI
jgi:hypothetical protein